MVVNKSPVVLFNGLKRNAKKLHTAETFDKAKKYAAKVKEYATALYKLGHLTLSVYSQIIKAVRKAAKYLVFGDYEILKLTEKAFKIFRKKTN